MQKLFNSFVIAGILVTLASCSKSNADLVVNEETAVSKFFNSSKKSGLPQSPRTNSDNPVFTSQYSRFYPYINQPYYLEIGDNGATLATGELAVFYVVLSPDVANEIPLTATLSTVDDATGQTIETFNLISYRDAGTVDAIIPAELEGTPFMLALVSLGSQYTDKTVTLTSDIQFNNGFSPARLERAFTVTP